MGDALDDVPGVPRLLRQCFCGPKDSLGQVQSPWRCREAIKNIVVHGDCVDPYSTRQPLGLAGTGTSTGIDYCTTGIVAWCF